MITQYKERKLSMSYMLEDLKEMSNNLNNIAEIKIVYNLLDAIKNEIYKEVNS